MYGKGRDPDEIEVNGKVREGNEELRRDPVTAEERYGSGKETFGEETNGNGRETNGNGK